VNGNVFFGFIALGLLLAYSIYNAKKLKTVDRPSSSKKFPWPVVLIVIGMIGMAWQFSPTVYQSPRMWMSPLPLILVGLGVFFFIRKCTQQKVINVPPSSHGFKWRWLLITAGIIFVLIVLSDRSPQKDVASSPASSPSQSEYCSLVKSDKGFHTISSCSGGKSCVPTSCVHVTKTTDAGAAYSCDGVCR
jgi:hypothetical protein